MSMWDSKLKCKDWNSVNNIWEIEYAKCIFRKINILLIALSHIALPYIHNVPD